MNDFIGNKLKQFEKFCLDTPNYKGGYVQIGYTETLDFIRDALLEQKDKIIQEITDASIGDAIELKEAIKIIKDL